MEATSESSPLGDTARYIPAPPEAKAIWMPIKPSPLKGLFYAFHRLSVPSVGLAFRLAGGFNLWRCRCTLLFALLMVFGAAGGIKGQNSGNHATPPCPLRVIAGSIFELRARWHSTNERYDDAITDLTAAIRLEPEDPELYILRGQMYLALYEWDATLADYNAALELAPDYADAYYYRGLLYASILQTGLDTRDDALADFRRYLDLAPDGDHAANAAQYVADLQAAQDTLNG